MKASLKDRLLKYMLTHHTEWFPSGTIQRMVSHHTTYSPQNTGRRLRELEEAGELEVKYVKGHAYYRARPKVDADALFEMM